MILLSVTLSFWESEGIGKGGHMGTSRWKVLILSSGLSGQRKRPLNRTIPYHTAGMAAGTGHRNTRAERPSRLMDCFEILYFSYRVKHLTDLIIYLVY